MEKLAVERQQQGGSRVTTVTIAHEMDAAQEQFRFIFRTTLRQGTKIKSNCAKARMYVVVRTGRQRQITHPFVATHLNIIIVRCNHRQRNEITQLAEFSIN